MGLIRKLGLGLALLVLSGCATQNTNARFSNFVAFCREDVPTNQRVCDDALYGVFGMLPAYIDPSGSGQLGSIWQ